MNQSRNSRASLSLASDHTGGTTWGSEAVNSPGNHHAYGNAGSPKRVRQKVARRSTGEMDGREVLRPLRIDRRPSDRSHRHEEKSSPMGPRSMVLVGCQERGGTGKVSSAVQALPQSEDDQRPVARNQARQEKGIRAPRMPLPAMQRRDGETRQSLQGKKEIEREHPSRRLTGG